MNITKREWNNLSQYAGPFSEGVANVMLDSVMLRVNAMLAKSAGERVENITFKFCSMVATDPHPRCGVEVTALRTVVTLVKEVP